MFYFLWNIQEFEKYGNLLQIEKTSETDFGFLEYFFDSWYARKPKRFASLDFGNPKGILAYPFGYQLSFSGNISFREYLYGFWEYDLVSDSKKKVL